MFQSHSSTPGIGNEKRLFHNRLIAVVTNRDRRMIRFTFRSVVLHLTENLVGCLNRSPQLLQGSRARGTLHKREQQVFNNRSYLYRVVFRLRVSCWPQTRLTSLNSSGQIRSRTLFQQVTTIHALKSQRGRGSKWCVVPTPPIPKIRGLFLTLSLYFYPFSPKFPHVSSGG